MQHPENVTNETMKTYRRKESDVASVDERGDPDLSLATVILELENCNLGVFCSNLATFPRPKGEGKNKKERRRVLDT